MIFGDSLSPAGAPTGSWAHLWTPGELWEAIAPAMEGYWKLYARLLRKHQISIIDNFVDDF